MLKAALAFVIVVSNIATGEENFFQRDRAFPGEQADRPLVFSEAQSGSIWHWIVTLEQDPRLDSRPDVVALLRHSAEYRQNRMELKRILGVTFRASIDNGASDRFAALLMLAHEITPNESADNDPLLFVSYLIIKLRHAHSQLVAEGMPLRKANDRIQMLATHFYLRAPIVFETLQEHRDVFYGPRSSRQRVLSWWSMHRPLAKLVLGDATLVSSGACTAALISGFQTQQRAVWKWLRTIDPEI